MSAETASAILVAGMHRSGTSALAGALNLLGIPLGNRLLEPGPDNPKGYWEHRDIVVVHQRLLAALGSRWDDVRALPDGWLSSEPARRSAAAIAEIVTRDFAGKPLWAVKDPRLCRLLPLWFEVLEKTGIRPLIMFMIRDPGEVSASIAARNQWAPPIGEILWLRHVSEALGSSRKAPRSVVTYDALLADPVGVVLIALSRLGLRVERPSAKAGESLGRFIDAADRHHVHQGAAMPPSETFGGIARRVYDSLVDIAQGGDDWARVMRETSDFGREWQRQHSVLDAFGGMAAKLDAELQGAEVQIVRNESDLTAQIRWSEEAQQRQEALQAENAKLSSKLTAQIRWSEEAQQRQEALQAESAELSSKLTAQIRWSEEAQQRQETLQAENAELSSKLAAQIRGSEEAQQRQETLQAELATMLYASADQAKRLSAVKGKCERLARELATACEQVKRLENELRAVYASSSWRVTRPLRSAAWIFKAKPKSTQEEIDKKDTG